MYPLLYLLPSKPACYTHPYEEDCSHYQHSCGEASRALRSEPTAYFVR